MGTFQLTDNALLFLLQWGDSLFPSGAFSHSFGLESAVQSDKVKSGSDLSSWIRSKLLFQIFPCDLPLLSQSHRAGLCNDIEKIQELDAMANAMRLPSEIREGGRMIASRMIQTAAELTPSPWVKNCAQGMSEGQLKGDPAVAFGIVAIGANIPLKPTLLAYLYRVVSEQVSAALRLFPIGQQEGQRIIHDLLDWAENSEDLKEVLNHADENPSAFMPASEIGSMLHEISTSRLFQS